MRAVTRGIETLPDEEKVPKDETLLWGAGGSLPAQEESFGKRVGGISPQSLKKAQSVQWPNKDELGGLG